MIFSYIPTNGNADACESFSDINKIWFVDSRSKLQKPKEGLLFDGTLEVIWTEWGSIGVNVKLFSIMKRSNDKSIDDG